MPGDGTCATREVCAEAGICRGAAVVLAGIGRGEQEMERCVRGLWRAAEKGARTEAQSYVLKVVAAVDGVPRPVRRGTGAELAWTRSNATEENRKRPAGGRVVGVVALPARAFQIAA